jgi:hypothetical protein
MGDEGLQDEIFALALAYIPSLIIVEAFGWTVEYMDPNSTEVLTMVTFTTGFIDTLLNALPVAGVLFILAFYFEHKTDYRWAIPGLIGGILLHLVGLALYQIQGYTEPLLLIEMLLSKEMVLFISLGTVTELFSRTSHSTTVVRLLQR